MLQAILCYLVIWNSVRVETTLGKAIEENILENNVLN